MAVLALAGAARAQSPCEGERGAEAARLDVKVTGVRPLGGQVVVNIYPNDRKKFLARGGKVARVRVAAQETTEVCFWLPAATYEVAVHHDKDSDRRLDWNVFGPTEGGGFSNNPPLSLMRRPFEESKIELGAAGREVAIQMRYPR